MRPLYLSTCLLQLSIAHASTTLVDVLSADPEFSSLLRLLQRARMIPTLNKLNGSTLFAPTNEAIHRHGLWTDHLSQPFTDNVNDELRQSLFYHLLNYTAVPADTVDTHKTLLYPRMPVEAPSQSPAPAPPWMPIPGGSLGGEPQRLRLSMRDGRAFVGVDAFGNGGAQIVKGQVDAGNGILLAIDRVLEVPPNLARVVAQETSTSYFQKILNPAISKLLNETPQLTLFLPVDTAWASLHPLERLYLESEHATDDLTRILNMHAVVQKSVTWSDSFSPGVKLMTVDGQFLDIMTTEDGTKVADAKLVQPDIYAANGVLHTVSSLLIPDGALKLTPEKYLLALNCTAFVSLLHSVNLTFLINNTDTKPYTILAPRDDVINLFGGNELPERGSDELRRLLSYHFIPGRWTPKKLSSGMLLETALPEPGLDGGPQVVNVEVADGKHNNLKFGGAGVLEDFVEIDNTIVYFISRPLVPPSDSLQTALPSLELSSFLAAIFSTSLADLIKKTPKTTILVPRNSAFKRLGMLVSDHLLSASSKPDLEKVIMHHVLNGVVYSSALRNGTQRTFPTLEGSDVYLSRNNGSLILTASGGWAGMFSELTVRDMLTQTGVVHELSDVVIPRSVELTVASLVKAAKASTMASLVTKAGMEWILNGTAPPEGSRWEGLGLAGAGWTLLCPEDDAFKTVNLTVLRADEEGLRKLVGQHIVPTPSTSVKSDLFGTLATSDVLNNNRPIPMNEDAAYATLLSPTSAYGDLVFRETQVEGKSQFVVGIKNARGTKGQEDWAHVLSWGRTTQGASPHRSVLNVNADVGFAAVRGSGGEGTGGVILIDRLIVPYQPPWWVEYGGPAGVLVGGILAIFAFFALVRYVWRKDMTEATYEPLGGFARTDDSEDSG